MSGKTRTLVKELTGEKAWVTATVLILIGSVLRLFFLESLPYGLNQDEASSGYEAWALLSSGIDRNGKSWPVLFISWGSGQNVLMSYLAMPLIAVMGLSPLSIRLPNAIAGCITLYVLWRLAERCRGKRFGLCALFLLVINPWHIMASRWALESNLLPALLLCACYFLSMTEEKPKALIGAAVCFGLAPYAYGTVFFLLPPLFVWIALRLRKKVRPGTVCAAILIFLAIVFPIALCQVINIRGGEEISFLGLTIPKLIDARQNATSILGGGGLAAIRKNIMTFLEILHNGDDGVQYNALPFWQGGIFYFFGLPLSVLGIIVSFLRSQKNEKEWPLRAFFFCAVLCAALIDGNINRLNMIWLPMIYFSAVGGAWLVRHLSIRSAYPLAGAICCFLFFIYFYTEQFAPPGNIMYYPGLGEAIEAAEKIAPETLFISDRIRQPYIYALFYTTPLPERYHSTAEFGTAPDGVMQTVERFEGFEFQNPEKADLLILPREDAVEQDREILSVHGLYAVCR